MLRWRLAVLAAISSLVFAVVGACTDDGTATPATPDSGTTSGAVGDGICPGVAPTEGEVCALPEGTSCSFGGCGSAIGQCLNGAWHFGGNPAPTAVCPQPEPPAQDTACPPCWPAAVVCRYGSEDCTLPDASANRTVATCPNGVWALTFSVCGGIPDAGPDVQGDGGPDAD